MTGLHDQEPPRATEDIDFAVLIGNKDKYEELLDYFVTGNAFQRTDQPYRLQCEDGKLVDFLPFGDIESQNRTVRIGDRNIVELFTIGLMENAEFSDKFIIDEDVELKVTSLYSICILKFVAWNDRSHQRQKDLKDINYILDNYAIIYNEEIFKDHLDLIEDGWQDWLGARLLGRHMTKTLSSKIELKNTIVGILNSNLEEDSQMPIQLSKINAKSISDNIIMIKNILKGIEDRL